MRLLFVTPCPPDRRAPHGGGAYLGQVAHALSQMAEVGLVALQRPGEHAGDVAWRFVAAVPMPPRPTGPRRLVDSVRRLWQWRNTPLVAAKHCHPGVPAAIARALTAFRPDVCFVEMAQMAQYLPALASVPTVLTDHEAGCPANTRTGLGPLGDARDRRLWCRHVARFYPLATGLQAVTAADAAALSAQLGRAVRVRQLAVDVPTTAVDVAAAPPRALFLGNYDHAPNPEAARRIVRDVLPRLRAAAPECELWLAGPHAERIADLAGAPGVRVLGYVPDLRQLLASVRLLLAPVWSGGGFRMKALTALAHGVPVVSNELGARGGPARAEDGCARAESPAELAAAAHRWLLDAGGAARAGTAARAWVRDNAAPEAVARDQLQYAAGIAAARAATAATT